MMVNCEIYTIMHGGQQREHVPKLEDLEEQLGMRCRMEEMDGCEMAS